MAARPLAGLDEKLKQATVDADKFYERRLPYSYSEVAGELGVLKNKAGVKLTRGQYNETPVLEGGIAPLTEVRVDVSLTGDYRPLVLFINSLERDKMFFLIRSVALVGQQSGTVGVRLGLTTYLRAPVGAEVSDKSVPTDTDESATPPAEWRCSAMKIGTEDKKKLTILAVVGTGALGCAFYIYNALSVPDVPCSCGGSGCDCAGCVQEQAAGSE